MDTQQNELTDKAFWTAYWESKSNLDIFVNRDFLFHKQLQQVVEQHSPQTAIELGGFPGHYAIFLKKHYGLHATLLDYFVHRAILKKVLHKNQLESEAIEIIETDLFKHKPELQYDLVLSCGLIEHFQDTSDILQRHIQFLRPGGTLWLTLPNFRGVNGWVQKYFDRANYDRHYIACMDLDLLRQVCQELGLKNIQVQYIQRFSVWLENKSQKPLLTRVLVKTIWLVGKVLTKFIPFESRLLSPYIMVQAQKA